jgi:dihydrofolate reductase
MTHTLSLVVAMDRNRLMGAGGGLPWRLPNDLRWFRQCTVGKPIVMGRHTWESIGRALPERPNLVLTSRPEYDAPGATVVHSFDQALHVAADYPEIAVIGGAVVFEETLPFADRLYLTVVHAELEGDTWFPVFDTSEWRETFREDHDPDDRHAWPYTFLIWERIGG